MAFGGGSGAPAIVVEGMVKTQAPIGGLPMQAQTEVRALASVAGRRKDYINACSA